MSDDRISIAAALIVTALALVIQFRAGMAVWGADLATPDDPAHFVTGVMVHDYILSSELRDPYGFAESFYVRYPKVAIGHWPPAYYALQGFWYLVFDPTIGAARMLSFAVTLVIALLLLRRVNRRCGVTIGLLTVACFLVLPLVRIPSWMVMSDLLEALFVFLAVLAFASYLETCANRHVGWFILWSVLAILTKGSAWAIGIFAILAPLLSRRMDCFRRPSYWVAGLTIPVLGAPFFVLARQYGVGYADDPALFVDGVSAVTARLARVAPMLTFVPAAVLIPAVLAGAVALWRIWRRRDPGPRGTTDAVALTWLVSQLLFLYIIPLTEETRFLTPSIGPTMFLFGSAAVLLAGLVSRLQPRVARLAPFALVVLCFATSNGQQPDRVDGYAAAAAFLPFTASGSVMLVSSDPSGGGAFIAARLERDVNRRDVLLRTDKTLSHSRWNGSGYTAHYQTPKQVDEYLQSVPIRYVVVDETAAADPAQTLLQRCLAASPNTYVPVGRFPVDSKRHRRSGDIVIYLNRDATEEGRTIEVDLGPSHGNRVLRYHRNVELLK